MSKPIVLLLSLSLLAGCALPTPGPKGDVTRISGSPTVQNGSGLERLYPNQGGVGRTVAPPMAMPNDAAAEQFAVAYLNSLQRSSIEQQREVCGYFYFRNGQIGATPPRGGTFASCNMGDYGVNDGVFATYHTHGAFGADYDNEVPSPQDLQSDFSGGLDGYVSTPGGRVWHVDYGTRSTRQICGLGCVYVDPNWHPQDEGSVLPAYTLSSLSRRYQ